MPLALLLLLLRLAASPTAQTPARAAGAIYSSLKR